VADERLRRLERDQASWREQLLAGRRAGKWPLASCAIGRLAHVGRQKIRPERLLDHDLLQAWLLDLPGAKAEARERRPHLAADRADPAELRWFVLWAAGIEHGTELPSKGLARLHEESVMIFDPSGAAVSVSFEACLGPGRAWNSNEGGHRFCRLLQHAIDGRSSEHSPRLFGGACLGRWHPTMPAMQGHHYDAHSLGSCNAPFGALCWTELQQLHEVILRLGRIPTRDEFMAKAVAEAGKSPKPAAAGSQHRLASGRRRFLPLPASGMVTGRARRETSS